MYIYHNIIMKVPDRYVSVKSVLMWNSLILLRIRCNLINIWARVATTVDLQLSDFFFTCLCLVFSYRLHSVDYFLHAHFRWMDYTKVGRKVHNTFIAFKTPLVSDFLLLQFMGLILKIIHRIESNFSSYALHQKWFGW